LTGVKNPDPVLAARPALVVKIDNATGARPQSGFNEADLVFEEIVNDSLTRFAMVFQSGDTDPVGPIRSGRLQDVDLFTALDHPLFAWSGGNATVTNGIDNSLARLAGGVLDTRTGDEIGPSTMTFAAALIVVATVARVLRGEAPRDALSATRQGAEAAAGSIEALVH